MLKNGFNKGQWEKPYGTPFKSDKMKCDCFLQKKGDPTLDGILIEVDEYKNIAAVVSVKEGEWLWMGTVSDFDDTWELKK